MLLLFICLCMMNIVRNINQLTKIFVIAICGILLIIKIFPGIVVSYGEKIMHSFQEISSEQAMWNDTSIVQDWRGYEVYCAKRQFHNYTIQEKLLGKGFGATVDVRSYAHLVTSEDTLPYLHNGYYTALVKNEVAGITLIILYWCSMIYGIRRSKIDRYERKLALGIVIGMALSMSFIHGVFWGGNEEIFYLFLVWINAKSNYRDESIGIIEV